jgi:flavin-dependent dehydrogenase
VIGADGKNSLVARAARANRYKEVPPLMCWYYTYWTGIQDLGFGDYVRNHRKMIVIPTNGGLTCALLGWPHADFHRVRANIATEYMEAIQMLSPQVAERLHGSTQAERFYGMADVPNFFRKPHGPGWALVGDAGYHKDPVNAHGIADALRDADLLAEAVHSGLAGEQPMEAALAEYERRRNEDAFPRYEENCKSASFQPWPEDQLRLLAALRTASQEDINTFMGAMVRTMPRETFFNPVTLARFAHADD